MRFASLAFEIVANACHPKTRMNASPASRDDLGTLLRKARPFVAPHRFSLAVITVLAGATAGLSALEPLALKYVFDHLGGGPFGREVLVGVGLFVGCLLVKELTSAALDWLVWKVRIALDFGLLGAVIERLHALPLSFHRKHTVGAIMTKVERGIAGTVTAFSAVAFQLLPAVVYLIAAIVFMVRLEWVLALVVIAFSPLPAIVGVLASKEQVERERTLMTRWTHLFSRFHEVLTGIVVVRSFVMEEAEKRRFLRRVQAANRVVVRGVARDASVNGVKNVIVIAARVVALALGGYFVTTGRMTVGTLVAFLGYVAAMFQPVQSLTGMVQAVRRGRVALETVFEIVSAEDTLGDAHDALDPGPLEGEIELRDVTFGYRPSHPVLAGLNLKVRAGESVAVVGPSGAGKSTIMALLQRLYDPQAGQVRLDGRDLRTLKQKAVRRQIGVVLQEGLLFSDSIRANIAFGRPGASLAEIEAVARAANAHEFIMKLPDGYDTVVGPSGSTLSGGERQRIGIARALLKDAPILVLDEATSALDADSEAKVQGALATLMKGRTTLLVAHRLATVVNADRIVVVDHGRIVEEGRHAELVARGGMYAKLVARQVEGLLEAA